MSKTATFRLVIPLSAATVMLATGHVARAQDAAASRVVAEVGGKQIVLADLRDELAAQRRQALAANRLDAFSTDAPEKALNQLIDVKLLALAAQARELDRQPETKRRLDNLIDQSLAMFLVAQLTNALDNRELQAYYTAHPDEFTTPGQVRARHIVVKTAGEASAILDTLRRGADFAELARKHNLDSTKNSGGDLGWIRAGVMVAPFEKAVFALKAGQTSEVVATQFGFHIIRADEIQKGKLLGLESARETVVQKVVERRLQSLKDQLRAEVPVKIDRAALKLAGK